MLSLERDFVERFDNMDVLNSAKGECLYVDPIEGILACVAAAAV